MIEAAIDLLSWGTIFLYLSALLSNIPILSRNKPVCSFISLTLLWTGFSLHTSSILLRTYLVGHAPMANLYETLTFFSWSIIFSNLIVILRYKERALERITIPVAVIILFLAQQAVKKVGPLPAVLRTRWFEIHVMASFWAYALFVLAFAAAVLFLIEERKKTPNRLSTYQDILSRGMVWGLALFSTSMFTGSIWAFLAWGNYWLWEPKTLWSFILWFYYSGAIHIAYVKEYRGKAGAIASIFGLILVLITYMGVSVLMKSSHTF
ncbi:MAG: cytochrome c biogenesis protein CcsA [Thermodesulfobacteriota bacterium]